MPYTHCSRTSSQVSEYDGSPWGTGVAKVREGPYANQGVRQPEERAGLSPTLVAKNRRGTLRTLKLKPLGVLP